MKVLYNDYRDAVKAYYWQQHRSGFLALRLIHLKPAAVRDECLAICNERYESKDRRFFAAFFGTDANKEAVAKAINRTDISRYKQLRKFVDGHTNDPDSNLVELLAWLINFPGRPYGEGDIAFTPEVEDSSSRSAGTRDPLHDERGSAEDVSPPKTDTDPPPKPVDNPVRRRRGSAAIHQLFRARWKWVLAPFLLAVVAILAYWSGREELRFGTSFSNSAKCMRWVNDHFEETPCGNVQSETPVLDLDPKRLQSFRRVFNPETLSKKQLKALWYINRNNDREYYTGGGSHPVDTLKDLNRMSDYMIGRYFPNAR